MKNKHSPAHPIRLEYKEWCYGLTKLEYAAISIAAGLSAGNPGFKKVTPKAIAQAKELLNELEKENG